MTRERLFIEKFASKIIWSDKQFDAHMTLSACMREAERRKKSNKC